jgi:hypothetical protein
MGSSFYVIKQILLDNMEMRRIEPCEFAPVKEVK